MKATLPSPLGPLQVHWEQEHLTRLYFSTQEPPFAPPGSPWQASAENAAKNSAQNSAENPATSLKDKPWLETLAAELSAYFAGQSPSFSCELGPEGSDFQQEVWQALLKIPYGKTLSYQELCGQVGRGVEAVRAVATAVGKNPIWLIIPCHRVIRSHGGLGGYAGGLPRKQWLLDLEGRPLPLQTKLDF